MNMDLNKYQHGKIYKLTSSETTDIYIGSTTKPLCKRLQKHKCDYKGYREGRDDFHYVTSFDLVKYVNCTIEIIKEYPCDNKHELEREEGMYQRKMKCVNMRIAGRTDKEYRDDNKELRNENQKIYYKNNLEKYKKKSICECGGKYSYHHKSRHEKSKTHQDYIKEKV